MTRFHGCRVAVLTAAALAIAAASVPVWGRQEHNAANPTETRGHFDQALAVHAAVIRGDVAAAGSRAQALAAQLEQAPKAGSPTALGALVEAARAVQEARDVLTAAQATAAMLGACGRCHRAARVVPAFPAVPRGGSGTLADQMQAHKAAADLLFQGLVVPSDAAWGNGARTLATATLYDPALPAPPALQRALASAEERLHRLASEAAQIADPRGRAGFYAQFLAACADCHRTRRGGAVPDP